MSIILNFDSLDSANTYWLESFNRIPNYISINPQDIRPLYSLDLHILNYPTLTFSPKFISSFTTNDDTHCFLSISKINYRRIVHSDLPDSLYKRFFNSLKNHGYVVDSSTSYIILLHKPLTEDLYNSLQVVYSSDIKSTLDSLLDRMESHEKDTQYYLNYIQDLHLKCKTLETDLDQARQDLVNRNMTTWY